jgi:hypothetical protein
VKRLHYAMIAGSLVWLSAVLWLIISNAIVREIRPIGAIAEFLDKLPTAVATPIYILLWLVFLLGWIVLLISGARPLFRRRLNTQLPDN